MSKKKDVDLRMTEEKQEGKPEISNDVPGNRYQKDQQVATTDDALDTKGADSSFNLKKTKGKGSELKTEKISEVLTGSTSSGMGISASGRSVSGTGGGILGASNSTPQANKSRSDSRIGKKLDRIATKLNYTPCEQTLIEVDESKPLADAATEDQGYNGTYRNEFARSQKNNGAVPADLMYQRSVDFIAKDKLYFVEGQMNFQTADDRRNYYPSRAVNAKLPKAPVEDRVYNMGNYLHTKFHFNLDTSGHVKAFWADVEDLTKSGLSADDCNSAAVHRLIKANTSELDRMNMDAKAGDEKADLWSPLPRAIDEPTKAAALMSSIEAVTGAYVHLAYSKASTNMSFQLNRGPKDGLNEVTPAVEELIGWRCHQQSSDAIGALANNVLDDNYIFKKNQYRLGDPAIMIAAYDSTKKYHNKADLLLQPRGWRMHLQTADNNMNPLKVPSLYANVFSATETFSTIDHEYDPNLPIAITDKANLIVPFNFNEFCAFNEETINTIRSIFTYDTTNGYTGESKVIIDKDWFDRLRHKNVRICYKANGDTPNTNAIPQWDSSNLQVYIKSHSPVGSTNQDFTIIIDYDVKDDELTTAPTGYTLLAGLEYSDVTDDITYKAPKVEANKISYVSNNYDYFTDYPYQGGEYAYKYSDLRNNYIMEVKNTLVGGLIAYLENAIGAKIRELLDQDEFIIPLVFSTVNMTLAQIFICAATPWIVRVRENSFKDVIYYEDNIGTYPYSKLTSLKNVPFKSYLNFNYSDYDSPLETKVMNPVQAIHWTMPAFFWKVDTEKYVLPWYFNENDLNADGSVNDDASNMSMPSIRSGVRLGLLDDLYGMSEKDIRLSLDRLTKYFLKDATVFDSFGAYKYGKTTDGQIFATLNSGQVISIYKILSCPLELGLSCDAPLGLLTKDPADNGAYKAFTADGTATSFRIRVYTNAKNNNLHPTILSDLGVNISRGANYVQKWVELCANNATSNTDILGLVFGMGDDSATYSPFAELGSGDQVVSGPTVVSYQRSLNTRLQFLPFVISPFDGNFTGTYTHDIFDFAYIFGLCGFRASDYRESVYNREKRVVNEGLLFVSDPWIEDSPIISGAAKATGLKQSVGYELK